MASPTFPEPTATTPRMQTIEHPHRHGHGERQKEGDSAVSGPVASSGIYGSIVPTPVLVPLRPTRLPSPASSIVLSSAFEPSIDPSRIGYDQYSPAPTPSVTPGISTTEEDYDEEEEDGLQSSSVTRRPSSAHVTQPLPPPTSSTPQPPAETTTGALEPPPSSTEEASSSSRPRIDQIEIDSKNFPPRINHRLKKIPTVAGKALRYTIPDDSFIDLEDGGTRNLRLIFKSGQGTALPPSSWIQFNPETQEVYALPLEEQVSKWNFEVEAMDKEGKTVSDSLELVVQHHKGWRTVNHEFTLQLRIEQKFDFPSSVDWQLSVLNGLARFFGDPDDSQITVINATSSMSSVDKVFFTWTNDSLPRNECANVTLKQMYDAMTINERGEPSMALKESLGEAFKVKHISFRGLGQCELFTMGPAAGMHPKGKSDGPAVPAPGPVVPLQNFAPVLRNQVDHLNATVGQLLVFRVPEVTTFF
jgi:dystroglycan 1